MRKVLHQRSPDTLSLVLVDDGECGLGNSGLHHDATRPADSRGPAVVVRDRDESQMTDEVNVQEEGTPALARRSADGETVRCCWTRPPKAHRGPWA
jgi:hypothetical protein